MRIINKTNWNIFFKMTLIFIMLFIQNTLSKSQDNNFHIEQISTQQGLTHENITCLTNDHAGNLWIGTTNGLNMINKYETINYYKQNNQYSLPDQHIQFIAEDSLYNLWVGTSKGLTIYDKKLNRFIPILYQEKNIAAYSYLKIKQGLLIGGFGKLFIYKYSTNDIQKITIKESLPDQAITNIIRWNQNEIILTYSKNNAYVYNEKTGSIKKCSFITETDLTCIYVDKKGFLWYSPYQKGLYCFTPKGEPFFHLTTYNSDLSSNHILDITELNNTVWLATDNGINIYDHNKKKIKSINSNTYNVQSVQCLYNDNESTIWAGSTNHGVLRIKIHEIYTSSLDLTSIRVDGIFQQLDQLKKGNEYHISVPWNTSSIEIKINIKDSEILRKPMFRYEFLGSNRQKIETYDNVLNLISLAPGKYTIIASYNKPNGEWSKPTSLLHIAVIPPFWRTSWFIIGCILFIISIITYIAYMVVKQKQKQLQLRIIEHEKEINKERIEFLTNISHELKTPLTLIYSPLKRILEQDEICENTIKNELKNILRNAQKMKNLVNMILDFQYMGSKLESLHLEPIRLNQWIRDIGNNFQTEYTANNILIEFHLTPEIDIISLDKLKCEIVLSNLLSNALKYSNPNSTVTISTSIIDSEHMIRVSVSDCGSGFRDSSIEKLFTRFYRENHTKSGTGIGLAYSKQLIEMQHGRIGAYNNKTSGATFYFDLPYNKTDYVTTIHNIEISETDVKNQNNEKKGKQMKSAIIVEDNIEMNKFLCDTLKPHFQTIYKAMNGMEALEVIEKSMPDIIISDVMMPQLDGFELCRRIKNDINISHIPIVLLTARGDSNSTFFGYKMGAEAYISKPFDPDFLLTVITNILTNRENIIRKYNSYSQIPTVQESTISKTDELFLSKFNQIIYENLANPELDIKFLTNEMAMSRASLYNKLKVLTNMGVNDYICKLKIEEATKLLINTSLSITEISEKTGFNYLRTFSTTFKQYKGVSPSIYRQTHQKI